MADFISGFWNMYVMVLVALSILFFFLAAACDQPDGSAGASSGGSSPGGGSTPCGRRRWSLPWRW